MKIRSGQTFHMVKTPYVPTEESDLQQQEFIGTSELVNLLDEPDVLQIFVVDSMGDQNMDLVQATFIRKKN